jgi:hypothetical protein
VFGLSNGARLGRSQVAPSQTSPIDLSGDWELDSGGKVVITHLLATGSVFARFSPALPCHNTQRVTLFDSRLKVTPVGGGPPKISLEDGAFEACTRDKILVDSCTNIPVKAVWTTKFKEATVSADGNTITGKRFHEWIDYKEENGRYINCSRNPKKDEWNDFKLTRVCAPDSAKLCTAISDAVRVVSRSRVLDTELHTPTPSEWNQSVTQHKPALTAALDQLRKQFCDDPARQAKIDEMKALLGSLGSGSAQTPAQVVAERMKMASVDLDLKAMSTSECAVGDEPPPEQPGICNGVPEKRPRGPDGPGDNEVIDKIIDHLKKSLDKAVKMVEKFERETGKRDDYGRGLVEKLKKLLRHWEYIRTLRCVPREVMDLLKAVQGGRTDMCTRLCQRTADWLYSNTQGDQKRLFFIACSSLCED